MLSCPDLHRPYSEILKSSPPEVMKIKIDVIAELKIHSSVGFLFYGVLGQVFLYAHIQLANCKGHPDTPYTSLFLALHLWDWFFIEAQAKN
jgi:hypothetical protein